MNVKQITEQYLIANGYDGLGEVNGECACEVGDLMPCQSEDVMRCRAGYKRKPNPEEPDEMEFDYIIDTKKP